MLHFGHWYTHLSVVVRRFHNFVPHNSDRKYICTKKRKYQNLSRWHHYDKGCLNMELQNQSSFNYSK